MIENVMAIGVEIELGLILGVIVTLAGVIASLARILWAMTTSKLRAQDERIEEQEEHIERQGEIIKQLQKDIDGLTQGCGVSDYIWRTRPPIDRVAG